MDRMWSALGKLRKSKVSLVKKSQAVADYLFTYPHLIS